MAKHLQHGLEVEAGHLKREIWQEYDQNHHSPHQHRHILPIKQDVEQFLHGSMAQELAQPHGRWLAAGSIKQDAGVAQAVCPLQSLHQALQQVTVMRFMNGQ